MAPQAEVEPSVHTTKGMASRRSEAFVKIVFPLFEDKRLSLVSDQHACSTPDLDQALHDFAKLDLEEKDVPTPTSLSRAVKAYLTEPTREDRFEQTRVHEKLDSLAKGATLRFPAFKKAGAGKEDHSYVGCLLEEMEEFNSKPAWSYFGANKTPVLGRPRVNPRDSLPGGSGCQD